MIKRSAVTPFEWTSKVTNAFKKSMGLEANIKISSSTEFIFCHLQTQHGEDEKGLKLEKLANVFKFGCDL